MDESLDHVYQSMNLRMFHSNSLTITAKRCLLSLIFFSLILLFWAIIRKLELRSSAEHRLISSFDPRPSTTLRFPHELKPFPDVFRSEKIYPISAYYEPGRRAIRIFFLKHIDTQSKIFCSLALSSLFGLVILNAGRLRTRSRDCSIFRFDALRDFMEQYRGYATYCDVPPYISTEDDKYSLFIRLHMEEQSEIIELPEQTGRFGLNSGRGGDFDKRGLDARQLVWKLANWLKRSPPTLISGHLAESKHCRPSPDTCWKSSPLRTRVRHSRS
ncbi:hypothetical protein CRM22_000287 [Opisthorchis felineus]|uniref:Uncharacterized protein n=1 Tax=Opisthorchis felineus TaxID=147828 RepID=A0A4S2MMP5_OPIFE|nr:hypothetical protein CRM22_000287 [Opisthorchis felineus]